ncbi:SRPBCC family protein [Mycolicibacterium sp. CH28]|nr:SRPBCC family protein [Mycolicibacterium sp. CH28]
MVDLRRARTIAAEPQAIWDVLSDFGAISSWADNLDHSCLLEHGTDGVAIGTSRRVQVGRNTLVERIIDIDPPARLGYAIEGLPRRLKLSNRWALSPVAGDHTEVSLTSTVNIGANPVAALAERLVCRHLAKQSDALLAGLARRVEGPRG